MSPSKVRYEYLDDFPEYMVNDLGEIVNMKSGGMPIKHSQNLQGLPKITLVRDHQPMTRSPAVLVAKAFVEPERPDFDTVIHLNNDRLDCRASNLKWRPRWFAIAFHKQFHRDSMHIDTTPIEEIDSGDRYETPKHAVVDLGILYGDIVLSFTNESYTFPTMQRWRPIR